MPVQTMTSNLAARFGGRIAQANAEHKDKPLDLGFKRLPPGIRNGIGKLQTVVLKQYGNEEKIVALRGQEYLHVVGVVMSPLAHNGETVAGHQMFLKFPLCDIPANPANKFSKPHTFNDNWYEFQQFFKRFGIEPPNETQQSDPNGQKVWGYYLGAISTLAGSNPPRHYEFATRAWRPQGATEDRVEEEWGKQCEWNGIHDPSAGVNVNTQPAPMSAPPTGHPTQQVEHPVFNEFATGTSEIPVGGSLPDQADVVAALVEVAMNDPDGATEDARNATARLEEMCWSIGWTKEQTASPPAPFTNDWAGVGDMALTPPTAQSTTPTAAPQTSRATVVVGGKHRFCKRTKDGVKLKDAKGAEFPPQDVEVTSVDEANKCCTVKSAKDGKPVVDIRTKQPVQVKFEWLE